MSHCLIGHPNDITAVANDVITHAVKIIWRAGKLLSMHHCTLMYV